MPESAEALIARIENSTRPGFRLRLVARGLARGMIWRDGQLPPESPRFAPQLSDDLLSYGLSLVAAGLRLRALSPAHPQIRRAFERGGEAIESVVRNGDPAWIERGFYLVVAAAAYHLGRFSARAFSLLAGELPRLNLSPAERSLVLLMRRDMDALRAAIRAWSGEGAGFDDALAYWLQTTPMDLAQDTAVQLSLDTLFHRALASFESALESGESALRDEALRFLAEGFSAANEINSVPFWWSFMLAWHLLDDLWQHSFHQRLPAPIDDSPTSRWSELRRLFISLLLRRSPAEVDLWPSQIEAAARALDVTDDLVVALPTSAGKTRIAELCILRALALDRRVIFVTPLRALSAQTERTLRETFTPLGFTVSSLYGSSGATGDDIDSLGNRHLVVSTPEKLDFALRNNPDLLTDVGLIVLDEAHSIGTGEREIRYEVLVQRLLRREDAASRRMVCLSAILPQGDQLQDFVGWIRQDQPGEAIACDWRPTRQRFGEVTISSRGRIQLSFSVEEERPFVDPFIEPMAPLGRRRFSFPKHENPELSLATAWRLVRDGRSVLIYCPHRSSVDSLAANALELHRKTYLPSLFEGDPAVLHDALTIGREWLGEDHPAVRCLGIGVAVHHGQLPRAFQRAVERLLRDRHLKITIASPTLAQGLNLSATTVLFYSLYRAGERLTFEEFANVAGRAGRAFVDVEGQVITVAAKASQRRDWSALVNSRGMRDLRSGLVRLVTSLSQMLARRVGASYDQLTAYVLGNASAWDAPSATTEEPNLPAEWQKQLARLDSALLSLVRHDAPTEGLVQALDEALQSSLWQRTLLRDPTPEAGVARALLIGRAGYIWARTTPAQRKGYFFAGLSFDTGQYLDAHAVELNRLLAAADAAMQARDLENAAAVLARFGTIVFATAPFTPEEDLPPNWNLILRAWLSGQSMTDLAGGQDVPLRKFIEDALVYRLVWALEAIRVRATANGDAEENPHAGLAALAVETGTPDLQSALLIQSGLPSRVAALAALRDCPGEFANLAGLRRWLFSPPVSARAAAGDWPTADTAPLWRGFVSDLRKSVSSRWIESSFDFSAHWLSEPPPAGAFVRIAHDATTGRTSIFSSTWLKLGELQTPLAAMPRGVLRASVSPSRSSVIGQYAGPRDLRQT